jgi:hypothetical protein
MLVLMKFNFRPLEFNFRLMGFNFLLFAFTFQLIYLSSKRFIKQFK